MLCFFSFFPEEETPPRGVARFDIAVLAAAAGTCLVTGQADTRAMSQGRVVPSFVAAGTFPGNRVVLAPLAPARGHMRVAAAGISVVDTIP